MKYFKELTSKTSDPSCQNAVIMGRKTWESIKPNYRPLKGRLNIILTRSVPGMTGDENSAAAANNANRAATAATAKPHASVLYASSLEDAMQLVESHDVSSRIESVFVIGGGQVYQEAVASDHCSAIHLTQIDADYECDTFFPDISNNAAYR